MRYHSIADILSANEASHDRLLQSVAGIGASQEAFRPRDEQWTIGDIVEHLAIVNHGFLRITGKLLKEAEEAGTPAPAGLDLGSTALDAEGNQPPKFQAPEQVRPRGGQALAGSLPRLQETLAGFRELQPRLEAVDLSAPVFPHPAFGPLNAYQWMILLAEHQDRHRLQIEALMASPEFPSI